MVPNTRSQTALARGAGHRGLDDAGALGGEDGVKGSRELGVAIAHVELDLACLFGNLHREVARLVGRPVCARFDGHAGDPDDTRVVVDEHEHGEPAAKDRVDIEEAPRDQALRLGRAYR